MTMMMKKMTGTNNIAKESFPDSFLSLYELQQSFQKLITNEDVPIDSIRWFTYHMAAMQEELGEVLKADKRWKTHRNAHYDRDNKLEEIADVFVTALNLAMFSGFDSDTLYDAIATKIKVNFKKLEETRKHDCDCGRNRPSR